MANSKRNGRAGGGGGGGVSFAHDACTDKWRKTNDVIAHIAANANDAIKCLQDENNVIVTGPPYPQTTESKKKVAVKRAINRLGRVLNDLSTIEYYTADLQEDQHSVRQKLEASETAYRELEESASNMREEMENGRAKMKDLMTRLQHDEDRIKSLLRELETARLSAELATNDKMLLQERMRSRDDKGTKGRSEEFLQLAAKEESLRAENEKLRKEHMAAMKEKETRANSLKSASLAIANVERYKEVIAKVTADNMVFLMKLKQSEAALSAAQSRLQELQKEVEMSRGQWLEEASAEVQEIILDSLNKAEACESKLQEVEAQRGNNIHEWEEKLRTANEKLAQVIASRDWHERSFVEASDKYKNLEDENFKLQQKFETECRHRQHAEAESRGLIGTLRETNEQLAGVSAELAAALKDVEDLKQELFDKDREIKKMLAQVEKANTQLETQLKVNGALMKKKEAVEWELMEAQAHRAKLQESLQ